MQLKKLHNTRVLQGDFESQGKYLGEYLFNVALDLATGGLSSKSDEILECGDDFAKHADEYAEVNHSLGVLEETKGAVSKADGNYLLDDLKGTDDVPEVDIIGNSIYIGDFEKSCLDLLEKTDDFTDSAIEHVFEGQLNGKGQAAGYHYEGIKGTSGKVIPGTELPPNEFGVYSAKVEVNGVIKTANGGYSTFFPKDMSPQQVVDAINEAYSNKIFIRGNTYVGKTSSGITIEMFIDKNGKIISAFPKY